MSTCSPPWVKKQTKITSLHRPHAHTNKVPFRRTGWNGSALAVLEEIGEEKLLDRVASGDGYLTIAESLGVAYTVVWRYFNATEERRQAVIGAQQASAFAFVEKTALEIEKSKTQFELAKAKEMGYHNRWRASRFNRMVFGDKMQHTDPSGEEAPSFEVNVHFVHPGELRPAIPGELA